MVVADREAIAVLATDRLLFLIDIVVEAKCQERDAGGSSDGSRERDSVAAPVTGVVSNRKERCVMGRKRERAKHSSRRWKERRAIERKSARRRKE